MVEEQTTNATADAATSGAHWRGTARYEVLRCLGQGGMGIVYEVFDRQRRERIALKTLVHFDASNLYRFKQEFRTLADVLHPNLVQLHELVLDERDKVLFTMELVEGDDFLGYVHKAGTRRGSQRAEVTEVESGVRRTTRPNGPSGGDAQAAELKSSPADFDRLRPALCQLLQGVRALHAAGKLHRDLKPSNVRVTPEGRTVILDFGVATELRARRADPNGQDEIVGTVTYMAPEQASGGAPVAASDLYSVGAMLYEAIVGRPPFVGSAIEVLTLKCTLTPPAPSECVSGVPDDLDELCVALLAPEPEQRPTAVEILRRLGVATSDRAPARRAADRPEATRLVGREAQLLALIDAFDATRGGRAIAVRISGLAGLGKSAVAHHFLDELEQQGDVLVLRGRAYQRESMPYKAVDGVVDALSRHLMDGQATESGLRLPKEIAAVSHIFPVLRRVQSIDQAVQKVGAVSNTSAGDPQLIRNLAFGALRELFETMAGRQPVVVLIDDAQWGDLDSAALLLDLLRPPDAPPLLLLMTYRDEDAETSPLLAAMRERWPEGAEVRDVVIPPLDAEDTKGLALALLDSTDEMAERMARAVAKEAQGSPFLVEELVRGNSGRIAAAEATLAIQTLDKVVGHRLARLHDAARRLIEVVAVGGRPLPVGVVAAASGIGEGVNEAVALLGTGRLARTGMRNGHEVIEVTHDRIGETIVGLIAPDLLREHHGRLAAALAATPGADLEAVAVHMLGAGDRERAVEYAERAAEQAASKLAFDHAARLFRFAIETIDHREADAQRLRLRLATMLDNAGRPSQAADEYLKAARGATGLQRLTLQRMAAEQLSHAGRIDEAALALRQVLSTMRMSAPRSFVGNVLVLLFFRLLLRVFGTRFRERGPDEVSEEDRVRVDTLRAVALGLGPVDVILGASSQARQTFLALRVGDRLQVLKAMSVELIQFAATGYLVSKREREVRAIVEGLASRVGPVGQRFADGAVGLALFMRGRFREAVEALDSSYAESGMQAYGSLSDAFAVRAKSRLYAVRSCFFTGRLREEARRARALRREVEDRGDVYTTVCLRSTVMVDISLAADEPEAARRHVREAMAKWTPTGFSMVHCDAMLSEANIELYVGDGVRARQRLARDERALKGSLLLQSRLIRNLTAFLRGCCAIGSIDAEPASRSARVHEGRLLARELEGEPGPWGKALASLLRAAAANAEGERAEATEALREAIARSEGAEMWLHSWAARYQLGSSLGGEEGAALVAQGEGAMTAEGVRAPARMAGLLLPGRWAP
jgi:eukaryotic-like serine/threonine-protein kinase